MQKPQLTEEEKIAKKVKFRRTVSIIFGIFAAIAIIIFIIFAMGTKKNINTKSAMDSQELRSKLKQIVNMETKYFTDNGVYAGFGFLMRSKEIPMYDPNLDGSFKYSFDAKTGIATGIEKDTDVNGDNDQSDGLTLSIKWEPDITKGSHFFWTDEDKAEFKQKAAEATAKPASKAPVGAQSPAPGGEKK